MKLKDKIAIVTGAASGIGKQIATTYAREGARVAIADLNAQAAEAAAAELRAAGGQAMALAMDVTSEDAVNAGVAAVVKAWGGVDVLVSNAGIQIVHPVHEFPFADWKKMLAIHLDGAFLTTKACLPHMYAAGRGGCIIYMGSVHSKLASALKAPTSPPSTVCSACAARWPRKVRRTACMPTSSAPASCARRWWTSRSPNSPKLLGISEDDVVKKVMLKDTVDGEFTTVQDVADAAVFFAAFPNNALTGQSIVVSHGWYME